MVQNSYDLRLGVSVGPIRFGESRESIIQKLGEPDLTQVNNLSIEDRYRTIGLYLEYRPSDEACKHVSVLSPAQLIYDGQDLLMLTWPEIIRWLAHLDPKAEQVYEGWESETLGIAIHPKVNDDGTYKGAALINVFNRQYRATKEEIDAEVKREIDAMPSEEECERILWGDFE
jgi:hypothetical protein